MQNGSLISTYFDLFVVHFLVNSFTMETNWTSFYMISVSIMKELIIANNKDLKLAD